MSVTCELGLTVTEIERIRYLPGDGEGGLLTEGHAAVGVEDALVPACERSVSMFMCNVDV
jgi:hypothetical protein